MDGHQLSRHHCLYRLRAGLSCNLYGKHPHYPVPVFLIAQRAVHAEIKGQGLGKITLVKALEHLWSVNTHMKAYAVVVDCLNQAAQDFYTKFGFEILCDNNSSSSRTRMFNANEYGGPAIRGLRAWFNNRCLYDFDESFGVDFGVISSIAADFPC
jgi:hypothetical protein